MTSEDFGLTSEEIQSFPGFCERFFTTFLYQKKTKDGSLEDHEVFIHSNGICMIGIAPTHPAFSKDIVEVDFNIGKNDRSLNLVKGKSKKGGMILQELTTLCKISCADGSEYVVVSCIQGKLVEVNKILKDNPNLLKTEGNGYIAVVLPKSETLYGFKKKQKLIRERKCMEIEEPSEA